jgi:hypothetical protein
MKFRWCFLAFPSLWINPKKGFQCSAKTEVAVLRLKRHAGSQELPGDVMRLSRWEASKVPKPEKLSSVGAWYAAMSRPVCIYLSTKQACFETSGGISLLPDSRNGNFTAGMMVAFRWEAGEAARLKRRLNPE